MRWSIRNQILIPLVVIQTGAVGAIALATATLAARRTERQVIERLNGVVGALGQASFPYTGPVLVRMRGLSGAEFIAYAPDGRVRAMSFSGLEDAVPPFGSIPRSARIDSLGESPALHLDGSRYLAVPVPTSGHPHSTSLLVLYPEASWRQARLEAATPPLLLGGCALGLMVIVTSWIAHRISGRIRAVGRQVGRIAGGDFEGLDPGRARDEIADLARSIDEMCVQLKDMSRAIQRSERTRLLAQFAAGLAHQLRNSLAGARMSVQLHAKRCPVLVGDRSLEVALRQLAMTEEQVKGLLSLGRVEDRPASACDLEGLIREVALLVGPACEHAKVALEVRCEGAPLEAMVEESGLRSAVLNLALNAVEAAGQGGSVRLGTARDGGAITITVSDTGPGPPPGVAEALFEPFATGKPEGVGLGLALAQQVAARHGGTLSWHRASGLTHFQLSLPSDRAATRRPE